MGILDRLFGKKKKMDSKDNRYRIIKVRLSTMVGDTNRLMTIQELKEDYKDYLLTDTKSGESMDIDKLEILDIEEVVVKKRDEECC
ncbi:MAG: hypothetical protein C3F06_10255 [Candidatus Methanoperedenaceae archaeon]|nr:MAG: hypothetical protein C3F06_10255 [Candidatus Methanoperedenaceae archaeon]